jgi:hypothetical protein
MLLKIKDQKLLKDSVTGAIINIDREKIDQYHVKKKMLSETQNIGDEVKILKKKLEEIDEIKSDLNEIKKLLKGLNRSNVSC